MFVRKTFAGVLASTIAGTALALAAAPAHAAYSADPDDSKTSNITTNDLIGVGSDTSQHALKLLADAWNTGARNDYGQSFDVASFSALGLGTLPSPIEVDADHSALNRPSGSGPGRATLYGTGRASAVDFARSSGAPSATNFTDGMRVIPFALDTVVVAVGGSNPVASFNPTLTLQQLRDIYQNCTLTNWHDVNAAYPSQPIEAYVPKQGSGTEAFFKTSVLPAGITSYGACVKDHTDDAHPTETAIQEHDPSLFTTKPNAIVPFSKGRAELAGTVKVVGGNEVAFKRNLYNVVRNEQASNADIQSFFGEDGFVCSAAAHDLIKAAGFDQLATADLGGDCGKVLGTASSNFTINTVTTPSVAVTGAGTTSGYNITATLASSPSAIGTVTFTEGETVLAQDVQVVSGRAVTPPLKLAAGNHTVKAAFTPGQSNFRAAEKTSTLVVKAPVVKTKPAISETFPAKVKLKKKAKTAVVKGLVSVKGATGKVSVKRGAKVLKAGVLKAGKVSITLPKLKKGTYKLTIAYAGDATHLAGTKTFTIKVVK